MNQAGPAPPNGFDSSPVYNVQGQYIPQESAGQAQIHPFSMSPRQLLQASRYFVNILVT